MKNAQFPAFILCISFVISVVTSVCADGPVASLPLERTFVYKSNMYINQGTNLVVVSSSDPTQVRCVLGLNDFIHQIAFNTSTTSLHTGSAPTAGADYLFVVLNGGQVKIIDISDPANLQVVHTIDPTPSYMTLQIMVSGDRAYLTESLSYVLWNLRIFDFTNPASPVFLGETYLGAHYGDNIGGHIRALDASHIIYDIPDAIVQVQDVSDPTDIQHVFTSFASADGGLITWDQWVYPVVIDNWVTSMQIWNMADPVNPMPAGYLPNLQSLLSYTESITLMEKDGQRYMIIGANNIRYEWLVVTKITDPYNPRVVRTRRIPSPTGDVVPYVIDIVDDQALISGWNMPVPPPGGKYRYRYYLVRMDVTDPTDPQWVSTVEIPSLFVKDLNWRTIGQATALPDTNGNLILSNIGSSGEDGIGFDFSSYAATGMIAEMAPINMQSQGKTLDLKIHGETAALPGVTVTLSCQLKNNGGTLELRTDFSELGSADVKIVAYDGDVSVGQSLIADSDAVGSLTPVDDGPMPQFTGFKCGPTPAIPVFSDVSEPAAIVLHFDSIIRFTSDIGESLIADRLMILPQDATADIETFTGFDLRGTSAGFDAYAFTIKNGTGFVLDPVCGDDLHPYPQGDLNEDCRVDMTDAAVIAAGWLKCTSPECD